jgi:hypothetical protein
VQLTALFAYYPEIVGTKIATKIFSFRHQQNGF